MHASAQTLRPSGRSGSTGRRGAARCVDMYLQYLNRPSFERALAALKWYDNMARLQKWWPYGKYLTASRLNRSQDQCRLAVELYQN